MKIVEGDLIALAEAGVFDVILHGCNCFRTMGKGIAKSIRQAIPEAYEADLRTAHGDRAKLGTFSAAQVRRGAHLLTVVNAYTQYDYRGPQPNADYEAIAKAFLAVKRSYAGVRIAYPKIGAGLARGDWARISGLIEETLAGEDHTLVLFKPLLAGGVAPGSLAIPGVGQLF